MTLQTTYTRVVKTSHRSRKHSKHHNQPHSSLFSLTETSYQAKLFTRDAPATSSIHQPWATATGISSPSLCATAIHRMFQLSRPSTTPSTGTEARSWWSAHISLLEMYGKKEGGVCTYLQEFCFYQWSDLRHTRSGRNQLCGISQGIEWLCERCQERPQIYHK
jgi:hypothetical protein